MERSARWSKASDSELVVNFQKGEREAFDEIDRRFRPRLSRFLNARVGNRETAEDLTQEALMRAFNALNSLRDGVFLTAWLEKVALFTYVDWVRSRRLEQPCLPYNENEDEEDRGSVTSSSPALYVNLTRPSGLNFSNTTFNNHVDLKDECDNVWKRARDVLSPIEFQTLWLRYVDELDDSEIALSLGKKPGAVRTALCRARRKLSKKLKNL